MSEPQAAPLPPRPPCPPVSQRSRNGKVARLPKPIRDSICLMLQDGFSYPRIIRELGEAGKGLTPQNISEWKRGGFLDWQREQEWQRHIRAQQEAALELLHHHDEAKLHQVVLQIALTQAFQNLRSLLPDNLNGKFDSD